MDMEWSICPQCGYDVSPGGGCYCWDCLEESPAVAEPRPDACPGWEDGGDGPDV